MSDDPYIKWLRFQRKNFEEFGEQLKKLEDIKLKIVEHACDKLKKLSNYLGNIVPQVTRKFNHFQFSFALVEGLGIGASFRVWGNIVFSSFEHTGYTAEIHVHANSIGASNAGNVSYFGNVHLRKNGRRLPEVPLIYNHSLMRAPHYIGSASVNLSNMQDYDSIHLKVSYIVRTTSGVGAPLIGFNRRIINFKEKVKK